MADTDLRDTVGAIWRMEAAKIVATLTRAVGDVGLAEDLAQEALVDALAQWPSNGVPRNPGAWLTTVAKRKAVDLWRRQDNLDTKYAVLARELEDRVEDAALDASIARNIGVSRGAGHRLTEQSGEEPRRAPLGSGARASVVVPMAYVA